MAQLIENPTDANSGNDPSTTKQSTEDIALSKLKEIFGKDFDIKSVNKLIRGKKTDCR